MGVLDRVATPEEFEHKYPDLIDARFQRLYDSTVLVLRSPDPVTVSQNINVDAHILNMGQYDKVILKYVTAANKHAYPTLYHNPLMDDYLVKDRSKLGTWRKGLRWSLMTSVRLREPRFVLSLPSVNASDATWIIALHKHQARIGNPETDLPAVVYKVAIEHMSDNLAPDLVQQNDPVYIKTEKEKRAADRARIAKYLGARPLPDPEYRQHKGFIAGDS
eukprot:14169256-Heterocapsa_arctica.AAC.1